LALQSRGAAEVFRIESRITGTHLLMDHGHGLRNGEIVIHRVGEFVGNSLRHRAGKLGALEPSGRAIEKDLDAIEGSLRLEQRPVVVVDGRAIVRGAEVVAHDKRARLVEELGGVDRVAERLGHLLAIHIHESVVHPGVGEAVPGGG